MLIAENQGQAAVVIERATQADRKNLVYFLFLSYYNRDE
jgi:hypothetical protein